MLCRVAEELFWLSRYVERAIAVGRLIDVTWHLELDSGDPGERSLPRWASLLGRPDETAIAIDTSPRAIRYYLGFDTENPNSLISCVRAARQAARGVREAISSEMWEQLNTLYLSLADPALAQAAEDDPAVFYRRVREGAQFVQGLADATLAHDEPWHFISLGKYLERADNVTRVLALHERRLSTEPERVDDLVRWLAVLRSCGSAEAYARYYSLRIEPARVVEFLLLNSIFPQSVRYCLTAAGEALAGIVAPRLSLGVDPGPAFRAVGRLRARLDYVGVDEIFETGLRPFLLETLDRIAAISELVTRGLFRDEPHTGRMIGVARAAAIMAAQQQQQ